MGNTTTLTLGEAQISVLTDGASTFGPEMFPGTEAAHIDDVLKAGRETEIRTNFNANLIRTGGKVVLVDAGAGSLFGPACGHLPEALAERGVTPQQIDILYATHLHPDHVAGAVTKDGKAVFANAELVVQEADADFWRNEIPGAPQMLLDWQALARTVLRAYGDRLRLIEGESEIAPGLHALPLPGHTPGHAGYRLSSGGQQLVHVGDIVHAPHVQIPDPEIAIVFDIDPDTARAARKRLLDQLAGDGALITGGHLLAPAFYRVERNGRGYRLAKG
ncbi:MBL fold metallo-hydrolase [Pararhodobacter marinus]|uniref:MBL fold metallo-hydrolase n=1 Tax=Pararhodobacter marinus TaxID=2184063 RepID=UPI0035152EF5